MNPQHLSDEAVAAYADGVLTGSARNRAAKHIAECAECSHAVRVQREAAFALRAALSPSVPLGLLDKLRTVPQHTPITTLPTVLGDDGSPMLATFARVGSPAAALVPPTSPGPRRGHGHRPFLTSAAVVALAGALATGVAVADSHGSSPDAPSQSPVQLTRIVTELGR